MKIHLTAKLFWLALNAFQLSCNEGQIDPPATVDPPEEARPLVSEQVAAGEGEKSALCAKHSYQYANDIKALSTAQCSCHEAGTKPDLTASDKWQLVIDSTINRIQGIGQLMPLARTALSTDQINGIKNWKECDFLE